MVAVPEYVSDAARQGLKQLKFAGDGLRPKTVAEARQLAAGNASPNKVRRMAAWFARHAVDLESPRATAYLRGESDRPTAGQVAWLLWGGSLGESRMDAMKWAEKTRDRLIAEGELNKAVSEGVATRLADIVSEHNDKYGQRKGKRINARMLASVFERGVGAYHTNPESVRPSVKSPEQWAYGRINAFLFAVRTGRFRGGAFDRDLLPEGHPLTTRGK